MVTLSEHCSLQVHGGQRKNQDTLRLQTVTKREHVLGLELRQRNLVRAVEFLMNDFFRIFQYILQISKSLNSTPYVLQTGQIASQYNRDDLARLHLPSTPNSVPGQRTLNGHRISRTHSHLSLVVNNPANGMHRSGSVTTSVLNCLPGPAGPGFVQFAWLTTKWSINWTETQQTPSAVRMPFAWDCP